MWKTRVQKVYSSLDELKAYDALYEICKSCGYDSAEKLWNDNPFLQGSTNPSDFGLWKPKPKKTKKVKPYDTVGNIIAFEADELSDAEIVELFVNLANSGMVWELQGTYQKWMYALLEQGQITRVDGTYTNTFKSEE